MDLAQLKIPENNGETLFLPPFNKYGQLLKNNLAQWGDYPDENRRAVQEEFLNLAHDYTKSLGLDPGPFPPSGKPVISAGSQPVAFHPGVAIKNMALTRQAEILGAIPLFITVDSDELKGGTVPTPQEKDGVITYAENRLFEATGSRFEMAKPVLSSDQLREKLLAIVNEYGSTKNLVAPKEEVERFLDALEDRPLPESDYVGRAITLRRIWEEPATGGFLELPVSLISQTSTFLSFANRIIDDIENFSKIYNGELARYRKERKLRYKANPFPDLAVDADYFETPFWLITEDGREALFAKKEAGQLFLKGANTETIPAKEVFEEQKWGVRPKAITLSIFLRLYVCDLFIHGVGGAKYDNVTDGIIKLYYKKEPPAYTCVSATCYPQTFLKDPSPEITKIRRKFRDIDQNPESVAELAGHDILPLISQKAEHVKAIKEEDADKKSIGREIASLNKKMSAAFGDTKKKLDSSLKELELRQKEYEAIARRDYPYFFFNPKRIALLLR